MDVARIRDQGAESLDSGQPIRIRCAQNEHFLPHMAQLGGRALPLIDVSQLVPYPDDDLHAEHREMIAALNDFHQSLRGAAQGGGDSAEIAQQLQELQRRCTAHFRCEEGFLTQLGYPALTQHRLAHQRFEGLLSQIQRALVGNIDTKEILALVEGEVSGLMIRHMNEADQAAAVFAAERSDP